MAGSREIASNVNTILYIDPTNMSKLETSIVQQFLDQQLRRGERLVRRDRVYEDFMYKHPITSIKAVCDLQFYYSMVLYVKEKHPERDYFAVIGDTHLGKGGTAVVNKVKGKLKRDDSGAWVYVSNKSQPSNPEKQARSKHVVKVEVHNEEWTAERTLRAYHLARRNKKLGMCYPTFFSSENTSVTIMKRLKDYSLNKLLKYKDKNPQIFEEMIDKTDRWELFEIFKLEELGLFIFTNYERLLYCREILKAYNEQIRDVKIEHRDIKAENIIIDCSDLIPKVTFFDYGLARDAREADSGQICGTIGYIPPEVLEFKGTCTGKSGLYQLSCVLAQIWGDRSAYDEFDENDELGYMQSINRHFTVREDTPMSVFELLHGMSDRDPEMRPSTDEAIAVFDKEMAVYEASTEFSLTPPTTPGR